MPIKDTSQIKGKILFVLQKRGPSLPVHIAGETGLSILFASAFLSELLSEKKIKLSNMRVGSSPIYFIPGQEPALENFSHYLKSKEKDAFVFLKQKRFLKDIEQDPAIRVALRAIKDFAIPFKKNDEIFWRYFTIPEKELKPPTKKGVLLTTPKKISEPSEPISTEQELNIFDDKTEKKTKKIPIKKKVTRKKQNDKFFNKVKEFLSEKSIEILDIESFSKNDLVLKVKIREEEKLLVAYNKKRINENDITKAHKKASELNLSYIILSLGNPLKKLDNLIEAINNLSGLEKIE